MIYFTWSLTLLLLIEELPSKPLIYLTPAKEGMDVDISQSTDVIFPEDHLSDVPDTLLVGGVTC